MATKNSKKTVPSTAGDWASDAFHALEKALIAFEADYPDPEEEDRLELVGYAAEIAAQARGIRDPAKIDAADEYAVDNVLADLDTEESSDVTIDAPRCAVLFLLCYLDVHVAFGLLRDDQLQPIVDELIANYDLAI